MLTLKEIEKHIDWLDREEDKSFAEYNRIFDTRFLIRALRKAIELEPQLIHHELFKDLFDDDTAST